MDDSTVGCPPRAQLNDLVYSICFYKYSNVLAKINKCCKLCWRQRLMPYYRNPSMSLPEAVGRCWNMPWLVWKNMMKANRGRQLNVLRRQPRVLNLSAKMKVFNVCVRASLNYCPLVWINRKKTDLGRLEKVQERAGTCPPTSLQWQCVYTYQDLLLYRANIPSVLIKWQRILLTEGTKFYKKYVSSLYSRSFKEKRHFIWLASKQNSSPTKM